MIRDALGETVLRLTRPLESRRRFRLATARFRPLPSVYVIGAPRCGTTALFEHLRKHPAVIIGRQKEPLFWGSPSGLPCHFDRGLNWYRQWYPTSLELDLVSKKAGARAITVDATPTYLYSDEAPRRLRQRAARSKIILLLRNPVDRAISDHNLEFSHFQHEKLPFEEAIAKDEERVATDFRHAYLHMGIYEPHIRAWMAAIPEEQFLILKAEDLFTRSKEIFAQLLDFLELPNVDLGEYKKTHGFRYASRPSPERRAELAAYFKPHNERLYDFLGRDFGWTA